MGKNAYQSTKTYGHELGLSTCFRQHRAESHCRFLHGYALSFKFTFECSRLNKGWVVDFGGLKRLKERLMELYDHKLLIAEDDPLSEELNILSAFADVRTVKETGCEAFAKEAWKLAREVIEKDHPHSYVVSCEVSEHRGNSAIYYGGKNG